MPGAATIVMLLVTGLACGNRAWTRIDSWYVAPSHAPSWSTELDADLIFPVPSTGWSRAEALLETEQYLHIGSAEAAELLGKNVQHAARQQFYLLRAVYLNEETGGFSIRWVGNSVHVHHASLGHRAVPMSRSAVVVLLEREPMNVYVTCSMAE